MLSSDIAMANQRLEAALLAGNMGWWEWDEASTSVVWSENLERLYGLAPGAFGGTLRGLPRSSCIPMTAS